ncbi:MAG: hypothetical protein M1836_002481 [Candelina mexicana]|nr:MAG: hypothetical protein M1836_002481 [Candelina mexicana]
MKAIAILIVLSRTALVWAAYRLRVSSNSPLDGKFLTILNNRLGIYPSAGLIGGQPYQFSTSTGSEPGTYALQRYPVNSVADEELCLVGTDPYLFIQDVANPAATAFTVGTTLKFGQWTTSPPLDQSLAKGKNRTLGYKDGKGARWVAVDRGSGSWNVQRYSGELEQLAVLGVRNKMIIAKKRFCEAADWIFVD